MRSFTHLEKIGVKPSEIWPIPRPKPIIYFVEPASLCNAACIFCHYPQMRDNGKPTTVAKDQTMESALKLVEIDATNRNLNNIGISLTPTTGDILVNKNWFPYAKMILDMPFIGWLDIVTNGILLYEKNIADLASLSPLEKLDFSISVGGIDRETYDFMFGTDMFVKVKKNIEALFNYLIFNKIKLNVTIRLRVPDGAKISDEQIIETFNPRGYEWASYEVLDTFKDVPLDVPGKDKLKTYNELKKRSFNPCGMLKVGAMNFASEGNITACGCHYSQMPGQKGLELGDVNTPIETLLKKREKLLNQWKFLNKVPVPCQSCQHYHQHDGAHSNKILLRGLIDADFKEVRAFFKKLFSTT